VQLQSERGAFETIAAPADFLDGGDHPPFPPKHHVGNGDKPGVGRCGWRLGPDRLRDLGFVAMRAQGASRDKGRRRGAAHARPAMNQQRGRLIPLPHEGQQFFDMGFARKCMTIEFHDDVGKDDDEMVSGGDSGRAANWRSLVDQSDEASRPACADRLRHSGEWANMDARDRHVFRCLNLVREGETRSFIKNLADMKYSDDDPIRQEWNSICVSGAGGDNVPQPGAL
jgi:hypothetical protein